jgi:hypothetical protein
MGCPCKDRKKDAVTSANQSISKPLDPQAPPTGQTPVGMATPR